MLSAHQTPNWTSAYAHPIGDDELGNITALLEAPLIFGNPGTICSTTNWRIDRQPPAPGSVNLQIQRNNVGPPSTISCVLVPLRYYRANPNQPGHHNQVRYDSQMAELIRIVRQGLVSSARTHRRTPHRTFEIAVYEITGEFSN